MLISICFGFMMFIASLIELAIAKTPMWQQHNAQLANFELASLRLSRHIEMSRAESARWSWVRL